MEQGGADGVLVHAEVLGEDERHLNGMVDVRLARAPALVAVIVGCEAIRTGNLLDAVGIHIGLAGALKQPEVSRRRGLLDSRLGRGDGRGAGRFVLHDHTFPTTAPKLGAMGLVTWARSSSRGQCNTQSQKSANSSRPCNPSR